MTVDMKALKEAAGRATDGPWNVDPMHCVYAGDPENGTRQDVADNAWHNAPFIALATPSTILSLIERCQELEGALTRLMAEKATAYHDCIDNGLDLCAWCVAEAALSKADATS